MVFIYVLLRLWTFIQMESSCCKLWHSVLLLFLYFVHVSWKNPWIKILYILPNTLRICQILRRKRNVFGPNCWRILKVILSNYTYTYSFIIFIAFLLFYTSLLVLLLSSSPGQFTFTICGFIYTFAKSWPLTTPPNNKSY